MNRPGSRTLPWAVVWVGVVALAPRSPISGPRLGGTTE